MERWWALNPAPEEWDAVLAPLKGAYWVDPVLRKWLIGGQPEAQALWRQWLALHQLAQKASSRSLLVGLPVWGRAGGRSSQLSREFAQGLAHWLLPADVHCDALSYPLSAGALWEMPAHAWQDWHTGPLDALAQACNLHEPRQQEEPGAFVWLARVRASEHAPKALERLLAPLRPQDPAMQRLCMRLESFIELAGGQARVLPPTALWNADSLARLSWLREVLLQQSSLPPHLLREGAGYVRLGGEREPISRLDLRGETLSDISRILDSARRQKTQNRPGLST